MSIGDRSKAEILDHLRVVEAQLDICKGHKVELLEALKEAVKDCRCNLSQRVSGHLLGCYAINAADVIAKAEGRV